MCRPRPPTAPRPGAGIIRTLRLVPARIRHGRPLRLLLRAVIAAALSLLVLHLIPGQPSSSVPCHVFCYRAICPATGDSQVTRHAAGDF